METNKLIAEFMGYKLAKCNNGLAWERPTLSCIHDNYSLHGRLWREKDSYYKWKTSWDWLMPVIHNCTKIIENYGYDSDERDYIEDEIFNLDNTLSEFLNNDIESVCARVVEFIKYYNKNN
jgi:hypothetical protein